jgi:osmotically-inducible protein OsmY
VNDRDKSSSEATADQQKENASDRSLTQQIRKAILQDKSLSTYAHNVKVITQDGNVVLKGPVRSVAEKKAVEAKAIALAGEDRVSSQLQVAAK